MDLTSPMMSQREAEQLEREHLRGFRQVRPAPQALGPVYQALQNALCQETLAAEHRGTSAAELISTRDRWSSLKHWDDYAQAAKALGPVIAEAVSAKAGHDKRADEIRAELQALFGAWCEERGTRPEEYRELSYRVEHANF